MEAFITVKREEQCPESPQPSCHEYRSCILHLPFTYYRLPSASPVTITILRHAHALTHGHIHMHSLTHSRTQSASPPEYSVTVTGLGSEAADPHSSDIRPVTYRDLRDRRIILPIQFRRVCVCVCVAVSADSTATHSQKSVW